MEIPEHFIPNPRLRLREQLREVARFKHLSLRTEQTYWEWIRRFIQFHRGKNLTSPRPSPRGDGEGMAASA